MPEHMRAACGFSLAVVLATLAPTSIARGAVDDRAREILRTTGVTGGLIVHLGCGDGRLTAALRATDSLLVHGLSRDANKVVAAREYIRSVGLYGPVSIDQITGNRLPYTDNLVNLLITEHLAPVTRTEVLRVLCPDGIAYIKQDGQWQTIRKPRPETIDEWTHALHAADNNAVSTDAAVGPPHHIQWVAEPRQTRQHESLASVSVVVSASGRIFSIQDEGAISSVVLPSKWFLVARDAYNGLLLWRKPIESWAPRLRDFRSGPPALSRRLVAAGKYVYVTLGYGKPVCALDAVTGETVRTYDGTDDTREILYRDGVLFVVVGADEDARASGAARRRGVALPAPNKQILAIRADTGRRLWEKADEDTAALMPTTLATSGGRVFFQNAREILALDAETGKTNWRTARYVSARRPSWSAPTLVVHGDVVLSADRAAPGKLDAEPDRAHKVKWIDAPAGELVALSAKTGKRLWSCPCRESFHAAVDVLVADGLVWTGELASSKDPGITAGRDLRTGEIRRRRPADETFFEIGMPHHRCYRNRATNRFLILGRAGVEFVDLTSGRPVANHWVRGTCQYGVLPCNGLLYAPPHSCACYIRAKLNGFYALAPERTGTSSVPERPRSRPAAGPNEGRLERGRAFARVAAPSSDRREHGDWPTYRCDPTRSGHTPHAVPASLHPAWKTELGGRLSSVTIADGKLFVAEIDAHTVHALDAGSGRKLWHFIAGGRVDSPPTVHRGMTLFGSADGWLYCLRASDGALVWRFRAAPEARRVVAFDQLESTWPVHGSVLVQDDAVFIAAGRSSYLDGGIFLYRLDVNTGKMLSETRLNSRDPVTDQQPKEAVDGFDMPGALPDVLSSDGAFVYMRHIAFDRDGARQNQGNPHLFCPTGLLDDTWWHRSYWIFGTDFYTGYRDWFRAGREVPAGRLLVFDASSVYGFGRQSRYYYWSKPLEYHLFATGKQPQTVASARRRRRLPAWGQRKIRDQWSRNIPLQVRAMVLAAETLFVAGPPDVVDETQAVKRPIDPRTDAALAEQDAALEGRRGAMLLAVSAANGETLAEHKLDDVPVFDGMAATGKRLYLATTAGRILCFSGDH